MRTIRILAATLVLLTSSAFAADRNKKMLFAPSYVQVSDGGMAWGPTYKSVVPVNFDPEVFTSATSASTSGFVRTQTQTEVKAVNFVVGFDTHSMLIDRVEKHANGSTSYFGYVEGSQFLSHFAVYNGAVAGEIWLPSNTPGGFHRSLLSRGGGTYLVEWDEKEIAKLMAHEKVVRHLSTFLGAQIDLGGVTLEGIPKKRLVCQAGFVLTYVIDLLYLYDDTSLTWFAPTPSATAKDKLKAALQSADDDINASIKNSLAVGHVNLVGIEKVSYASAGNLGDDHAWMAAPEVLALRDLYKADVVGLWVAPEHPDAGGVAAVFTGYDERSKWITHVNLVGNGAESARHEFGHNLGMAHQPEADSGNPYFPFAHGHFKNGRFRDAVSEFTEQLCPDQCPALPIFSNPNVSFEGLPTGISNERENWRMVGIAFPIVSRYQEGSQPACLPK